MPIGYGGLFDGTPGFRVPQFSRCFTRKVAACLNTETTLRKALPEHFGFQRQGHFGRTDIAGSLYDLRDRHHRGRMLVVNFSVVHGEHTVLRIDQGIRSHFARLYRRCHGKRFHRGTRLEQICYRPVAHALVAGVIAAVGVVAGIVGECQHFTAARIENDYRTGFGFMLPDGILQFPVGKMLHIAIQTEDDVATWLGHMKTACILNDVTAPVLDDALAAWLAGKLFLQCQLQAPLARYHPAR